MQRNLDSTAAAGNQWTEAGAGNVPPATRGRADYLNDHMENNCRAVEHTGQELIPNNFNQLSAALVLAAGLKPQGLQLTWVDASNLTIGTGHVADSLRQRIIQNLAALTKDITADWVLGDTNGAMPATVAKTGQFTTVGTAVTGTAADLDGEFKVGDVLWSSSNGEGRRIDSISGPNVATIEAAFTADVAVAENVQKNGLAPRTWYHTHILSTDPAAGFAAANIKVDWGLDTDIDAVNLLADANVTAGLLTRYRRINSVIYSPDGVGIIHALQTDRYFQFGQPLLMPSVVTSVASVTHKITLPAIPCSADVFLSIQENGVAVVGPIYGIVRSPTVADSIPSVNNKNFTGKIQFDGFMGQRYSIKITDQTIKTRFSAANGNTTMQILVHGFHDPAED